jgi:hypothetical protein
VAGEERRVGRSVVKKCNQAIKNKKLNCIRMPVLLLVFVSNFSFFTYQFSFKR